MSWYVGVQANFYLMLDKQVLRDMILGAVIGSALALVFTIGAFPFVVRFAVFLPLDLSKLVRLKPAKAMVIGFVFSAVVGIMIGRLMSSPITIGNRLMFAIILFFILSVVWFFAVFTIVWVLGSNIGG